MSGSSSEQSEGTIDDKVKKTGDQVQLTKPKESQKSLQTELFQAEASLIEYKLLLQSF